MVGETMLTAASAGFVLSLGLCALIVTTQRWHGRLTHDGLVGPQKFHVEPTPRVGGAALAVAFWLVWPLLEGELATVWAQIGLAATPALVAGLAEDLTKRVGTRLRLAATMAAGALFVGATGYAMAEVDVPGFDWLLSFSLGALLFTAFSMGGVANAVNIIDGFNGLAAGACLIMLGTFAIVASWAGDALVLDLALLFAALVAGFLVVNFPSGRLFLGDGGAYFCGFLLAALGVLIVMRNPEVSAWTAMLICGYPVIETLASMRRKARRRRASMGEPDRVHLHMLAHRSLARRMAPAKAAGLRNPATSVALWTLPLATGAMALVAWDSALLSAVFFALAAYLYGVLYRSLSLNRPRLVRALAGPGLRKPAILPPLLVRGGSGASGGARGPAAQATEA
jgi:UDP-N-acetylmuramyl pentapeptide phosphotransferase/UDP-N-acetylglucosamine-1-phosphate transferase